MKGSKISAIEYYLPKKKENNNILKKYNPKWDIKRIKEKNWSLLEKNSNNVIKLVNQIRNK